MNDINLFDFFGDDFDTKEKNKESNAPNNSAGSSNKKDNPYNKQLIIKDNTSKSTGNTSAQDNRQNTNNAQNNKSQSSQNIGQQNNQQRQGNNHNTQGGQQNRQNQNTHNNHPQNSNQNINRQHGADQNRNNTQNANRPNSNNQPNQSNQNGGQNNQNKPSIRTQDADTKITGGVAQKATQDAAQAPKNMQQTPAPNTNTINSASQMQKQFSENMNPPVSESTSDAPGENADNEKIISKEPANKEKTENSEMSIKEDAPLIDIDKIVSDDLGDKNELFDSLPDNYLKGKNVGARVDETKAAYLVNCEVDELIRITELYNEYLTCIKVDGHYLYNGYDISTILNIVYEQDDNHYTDSDMLDYMEGSDSYTKPFKQKNNDKVPEEVRLAVNQAFKGYARELQNSVRSLVGQLTNAVTSMNDTISSQRIMLERQSETMRQQTEVIMKMAAQLEDDTKVLNEIRTLPNTLSELPASAKENAEKQDKAMQELTSQVRSGQDDTKKAISDVMTEIEKLKEAKSSDPKDNEKLDKLADAIEKLSENQNKEADKLSKLSDNIDTGGELKKENEALAKELEDAKKELEAAKDSKEFDILSENYTAAQEKLKELEDKLTSTTDALNIAHSKEQAHNKELSEFKEKAGSALKNMAAESDKKSVYIKQLEQRLVLLRQKQIEKEKQNSAYENAAHSQSSMNVQRSAPQGQQTKSAAEAPPTEAQKHPPGAMTSEQRKALQRQYAGEVRKKQPNVPNKPIPSQKQENETGKPSIPSWAATSQYEEEEEEDVPVKKEKHGLFGRKKQKEPIIEDVELDDDAELTQNKTQKKKGFGFLR